MVILQNLYKLLGEFDLLLELSKLLNRKNTEICAKTIKNIEKNFFYRFLLF